MEKEQLVRKGPWTEEEDAQLVFYVNLFGDRRWDFIAKVSGLKRTGKSCRLRWVNYLHPGLKRGKMTPREEKLVLDLHSKWGNRWSRIARKIPGRTDNEIKNYWRTHMRKKAQDQKKKNNKTISPSLSSSSSSSSSSFSNSSDGVDFTDASRTNTVGGETEQIGAKVYSMDEIWKDIELSEESSNFKSRNAISPTWDICTNDSSLWSMGEEEEEINKNMLIHPMGDHFHSFPFYNHNII